MSNLTLDGSQAKFDRSDTKAVKGVAVVLMLFHHLAGFPSGFPSVLQAFAQSGRSLLTVGTSSSLPMRLNFVWRSSFSLAVTACTYA